MSEAPRIYLAGKVAKGDEIGRIPDWRKQFEDLLATRAFFEFLTPDDPSLDENDPLSVVGHDCYLIRSCSIVVVNASERLGVGTAQELLIAKYFSKPVFTFLPHGSPHRRRDLLAGKGIVSDWKHPFLVTSSDQIFSSLDELASFLSTWKPSSQCKDLSIIDQSIRHYLASK